jgi:hypothetical protein
MSLGAAICPSTTDRTLQLSIEVNDQAAAREVGA